MKTQNDRNTSFLKQLFLYPFLLILSACGNFSYNKELSTDGGINLANVGVDFATIKTEILQPKCLECHSQYNSYSSVKRESKSMLTSISSGRMPKRGAPLEPRLQSLFKSWVDAGAPEFSGANSGQKPEEPLGLEPNWKSISELIVFPKCLVCHNPNGEAKFLDLSTRQSFFEKRDELFGEGQKFLDFLDPANSYVIGVITDEFEPMPPEYSGLPRLNEDEVRTLMEWIGLGLP